MKPNALVFFQYLPPWRIDVFNEMATYYNLTIVFTDSEHEAFKYNRKDLLEKLDNTIKTIFLTNGFKIGSRPIRLGISKIIRDVKPNIIFAHEYSPTNIFVAIYYKLKIFNFQYVITTSDNILIAKSVKGIKSYFRKFILSTCSSIVVYSNEVAEFYKKKFSHLRVEICPNIQNPNSLLKNRPFFKKHIESFVTKFDISNHNIILYTGRLEKVKGLDLLLKAFSKSNNTNFKLVFVGKGSEEHNLRLISKELNIEDKVVFAGFYSGEQLYAWYDIANFYILPSRFEPFGAVVNEALVFGCPVLASKYIGAKDFINGKNGLLFDPLNEEEFVNKLNLFYSKFKKINTNKQNLMPISFYDYVKVFDEVYIKNK